MAHSAQIDTRSILINPDPDQEGVDNRWGTEGRAGEAQTGSSCSLDSFERRYVEAAAFTTSKTLCLSHTNGSLL